jgi:hypothetical protein
MAASTTSVTEPSSSMMLLRRSDADANASA